MDQAGPRTVLLMAVRGFVYPMEGCPTHRCIL
nr:MAG TPA: hypothetical protein [Caudoviricetes sp.]